MPLYSNLIVKLWEVYLKARRLINFDVRTLQNFLYKTFCRKADQVARVLESLVGCKMLRVVPMTPRRVGKRVDHRVTFGVLERGKMKLMA